MEQLSREDLFKQLVDKSVLKLDIYDNTLQVLRLFKQVILSLVDDYHQQTQNLKRPIRFETRERGDFEIELTFGGDTLLFLMHTNVFEFSRDHQVMRTPYIREDKQRSYCGIINIYNFLADSFKYNRMNDLGYLIGRVFVNKDMHYFIEGKRELGFLYNDFGKNIMDESAAVKIVEAAVAYTFNFDLLTPPYEAVKLITVFDMNNTLDAIPVTTGKRLGFRFKQDENEDQE